jgi:hypothetical protein
MYKVRTGPASCAGADHLRCSPATASEHGLRRIDVFAEISDLFKKQEPILYVKISGTLSSSKRQTAKSGHPHRLASSRDAAI